nr:M15 family metallopeptidase [Motilibacter aurantiacus]
MAANNTSAYNCRKVAGTGRWSEHSYGRAVDVNPVQNPYVKGRVVQPAAGRAYVDRSRDAAGLLRAGEPAVEAFTARGWGWGGSWRSSKDYQHFSSTGR